MRQTRANLRSRREPQLALYSIRVPGKRGVVRFLNALIDGQLLTVCHLCLFSLMSIFLQYSEPSAPVDPYSDAYNAPAPPSSGNQMSLDPRDTPGTTRARSRSPARDSRGSPSYRNKSPPPKPKHAPAVRFFFSSVQFDVSQRLSIDSAPFQCVGCLWFEYPHDRT